MNEQETRFWHPFADMGAVRANALEIARGEDVWVFDRDGRRYLDATAALWYCNVGHGRREIAEAVAEQMSALEAYSAFGDFTNRPAEELTARLADLAPVRDARVSRRKSERKVPLSNRPSAMLVLPMSMASSMRETRWLGD